MEGALREGERGTGVCMHDRKLALASYREEDREGVKDEQRS